MTKPGKPKTKAKKPTRAPSKELTMDELRQVSGGDESPKERPIKLVKSTR